MSLDANGISITGDDDDFQLQNLQLQLTTNLGTACASYDSNGSAAPFKDITVTTVIESHNSAHTITHTITNSGIAPLCIHDAATGQFSNDASVTVSKSNGLGWDLRFAHTDNLRTEKYPHCQMDYPYLRMLPTASTTLGTGEDQPFPALYLQNQRGKRAVIIAAASQELNYIAFTVKKNAFVQNGIFDEFIIHHDVAQSGGLNIPPGESVTLDGIYVEFTNNMDLNTIYANYIDFLTERHDFRGPKTTMLSEAMHCTWNYGVFADQREEPLLKTATAIAENCPGITYFLMDAGYLHGDIATTFLDRFYPDPNQFVSSESFPDGIKGYSDKLRELGLKPGIWWSPTAQIDGDLYKDHPDWFLRRADGGLYIIGEKNAYLDYSHPDACDYLDRTLAVIFGDWGMVACKRDFWSQSFESRDVRLHDTTMTAVQVRTRFFEIIRKNLPDDGVFMTCVAVGMGNPFIGQHADTYRNTIDIGVGCWEEQIYNCAWALPTLVNPGRKTFLLNNDSVGANLKASENENFFRFTWSFMHQGIIETGGRMEEWPDIYIDAMRRCTEHVDRGHAVRCADPQAFTGAPFPQALVIDYPSDSATAKRGVAKHIALFNWNDETQVIGASNDQLGLSGDTTARNFWTDEEATFSDDGIFETLPGRTARLFEICS